MRDEYDDFQIVKGNVLYDIVEDESGMKNNNDGIFLDLHGLSVMDHCFEF
jgi:hypothetical protein